MSHGKDRVEDLPPPSMDPFGEPQSPELRIEDPSFLLHGSVRGGAPHRRRRPPTSSGLSSSLHFSARAPPLQSLLFMGARDAVHYVEVVQCARRHASVPWLQP